MAKYKVGDRFTYKHNSGILESLEVVGVAGKFAYNDFTGETQQEYFLLVKSGHDVFHAVLDEKQLDRDYTYITPDTEIVVILDRSGSMNAMRTDAIGGFNALIEDQKKVEGNASVTLVLFDDQYEVVYSGKELKDVEPLTEGTYVPRGSTALLDAIGRTINGISGENKQVIVTIITDGYENASREFRKSDVVKLIGQKQENGWEFLFLGANMDVVGEASSLGIKDNMTMNFANGGITTAYASASVAMSGYRSVGKVAEDWNVQNGKTDN